MSGLNIGINSYLLKPFEFQIDCPEYTLSSWDKHPHKNRKFFLWEEITVHFTSQKFWKENCYSPFSKKFAIVSFLIRHRESLRSKWNFRCKYGRYRKKLLFSIRYGRILFHVSEKTRKKTPSGKMRGLGYTIRRWFLRTSNCGIFFFNLCQKSLFSSSVLYFIPSGLGQNEKMELHDVAEEFFKSIQRTWKMTKSEKGGFSCKRRKTFSESGKVQGKIWDMKETSFSSWFQYTKKFLSTNILLVPTAKYFLKEIPLLEGYILFSENILEISSPEETLLKILSSWPLRAVLLCCWLSFCVENISSSSRNIEKSHPISLEDLASSSHTRA